MEEHPSADQTAPYVNDPSVKSAADVKPVSNADTSFHSMSSQTADSTPAPPPPAGAARSRQD
ncbi:MAG: hypothetical protein WDO73_08265 [Ignavibacteriota bacterium]